ncbi:MAG: hypothetical protein FK734_20430 [Asgard group archaeon]|nr:hypothetical protein [Asgard group archaeon]
MTLDQFKLAVNIMLALYAVIVTVIFWFTWRKRSDLMYWFFTLIIFTVGHTILIFRQNNILFIYLGNAVLLIALLLVVITTYIDYYKLMISSQKGTKVTKHEKIIFIGAIVPSIISGIIALILLWRYEFLDILQSILICMIVLLIPLTVFVLRIYIKKKTITQLFMFFVFFAGAVTALSTIFVLYFNWGDAMNIAFNFIFITLIMTTGLAAPIEQRIKDSEDQYRALSEHLEEKVIERTKELKNVNEELEAFSYSVSHDLRAPLRRVIGFSQTLDADFSNLLKEEGKDHLQRIIKNSNRMNELIDDLLNLSRVSRDDMIIVDVDLSKLATEVIEELISQYPKHKFDYQIEENLIAKCDLKLMRIVLENLIGNAVKFSIKKDHPKITIGKIQEHERTIFFVQDSGIGFDMKYYDRLFGLFQRLHCEDEYEGTGIGLVTVKRIIVRHNGQIWAASEVNKGATFFFTLG